MVWLDGNWIPPMVIWDLHPTMVMDGTMDLMRWPTGQPRNNAFRRSLRRIFEKNNGWNSAYFLGVNNWLFKVSFFFWTGDVFFSCGWWLNGTNGSKFQHMEMHWDDQQVYGEAIYHLHQGRARVCRPSLERHLGKSGGLWCCSNLVSRLATPLFTLEPMKNTPVDGFLYVSLGLIQDNNI